MNKCFSFLFIAVLALSACKQDNSNAGKTSAPAMDEKLQKQLAAHQFALYETAAKREDPITAIYALNSYLQLDSSKPYLYDSLARMYFDLKNMKACSEVVAGVLKSKPNDSAMLMLGYVSDASLGNVEAAIAKCNKLYSITKNLEFKTEIVKIYLNTGAVAEAQALLDEIIADPQSMEKIVAFPLDEEGRNVAQIRLRASALFTKGYLYSQLGQKEKAVATFRKVLELEENFEPAAEAISRLLYRK